MGDRGTLAGASLLPIMMILTPAAHAQTTPGQDSVGSTAQSSTPSAPQDATPASLASDTQGDIIVTAQRRAERLQDVPVSVTAVNAADLSRLHIDNVARLEFVTPGLTWGSQGSDSFPSIRGVRTSLVSAQNDPVIGFYIDGIYQSRTQQQSIPLFDIGRVEVQRGPQGTLYGRNTFGGNLSVVTQEPTKQLGAGLNVDFGNYAEKRIDGYINLPISDTLQLRIAGVYQHHDGYVHSTTAGVVLDDLDENAERVSLKWTPTAELEVQLHAGHWERNDAGAGSYGYKVAGTLINPATGYQSVNGQPFGVNPSVPNGTPNIGTQDAGLAVTSGPYTNDWDYQPYEHILENYVSGTISYDLGPVTLRSITGYTFFRANRSADNDQSSKIFQGFGYGSGVQEPHDRAATVTQEVQIASRETTPFQWIIGGYYLHDAIYEIYQQKITDLVPSPGVTGFKETTSLNTDAIAGYAQGYYFVIPEKLRLIAGLRYSHESKSFRFADYADGIPGTYVFTTPYNRTSGSPTFNSVTYRAGVEFTPTRQTTAYATVSSGFESGGFNDTGGSAAIPNSYAPQKVTAYEVGLKNQFLQGHVQTDLSLFWNQFSNLQINVYTPQVSYFGSAGRARSRGVEAAVRTAPFAGLHVDATLAYLNARYTSYTSANNFYGLSGGADPVFVNLAGKKIPQSPDFKTTLSVYDEISLNGRGTLTPNVTWLHSSSYFTTDFNSPLDFQHSYDKLDLSMRYTAPDSRIYIEGYGDNVTNVPVLFSAVVGRRERVQVSYGPPVVYGVRAGIKF